MPIARDPKVLGGEHPAAWINDCSCQRPLMRIDPDHIARVIGREQSGTALLRCSHRLPSRRMLVKGGSADNLPVGALHSGERSYQARPILEDKNRGRHFVAKTPTPGVRVLLSQTSVQPSTLREPSPARAPKIQHRECFEGGVPVLLELPLDHVTASTARQGDVDQPHSFCRR